MSSQQSLHVRYVILSVIHDPNVLTSTRLYRASVPTVENSHTRLNNVNTKSNVAAAVNKIITYWNVNAIVHRIKNWNFCHHCHPSLSIHPSHRPVRLAQLHHQHFPLLPVDLHFVIPTRTVLHTSVQDIHRLTMRVSQATTHVTTIHQTLISCRNILIPPHSLVLRIVFPR